jgi:hypothetical protein
MTARSLAPSSLTRQGAVGSRIGFYTSDSNPSRARHFFVNGKPAVRSEHLGMKPIYLRFRNNHAADKAIHNGCRQNQPRPSRLRIKHCRRDTR